MGLPPIAANRVQEETQSGENQRLDTIELGQKCSRIRLPDI